tara:strand:+ start:5408 stop:5608 length:201 start_codon:yes stop_codon:yes gene_type:complete
MTKLSKNEERELILLKKEIFGNTKFFDFDGLQSELMLSRYHELFNRKTQNMLSRDYQDKLKKVKIK